MSNHIVDFPLPMLGFAAWSGTGKTTLLKHIIPLLTSTGLRVGLVKHAHHGFDMDTPGKDSYVLREAGACQIIVASGERIASIVEMPQPAEEPVLDDILGSLHIDKLDLVLVEGFKIDKIPKIELHRTALGRPYLYPDDAMIIALAEDHTDAQHSINNRTIRRLDLNQPQQIVRFILEWIEEKNQ